LEENVSRFGIDNSPFILAFKTHYFRVTRDSRRTNLIPHEDAGNKYFHFG